MQNFGKDDRPPPHPLQLSDPPPDHQGILLAVKLSFLLHILGDPLGISPQMYIVCIKIEFPIIFASKGAKRYFYDFSPF